MRSRPRRSTLVASGQIAGSITAPTSVRAVRSAATRRGIVRKALDKLTEHAELTGLFDLARGRDRRAVDHAVGDEDPGVAPDGQADRGADSGTGKCYPYRPYGAGVRRARSRKTNTSATPAKNPKMCAKYATCSVAGYPARRRDAKPSMNWMTMKKPMTTTAGSWSTV